MPGCVVDWLVGQPARGIRVTGRVRVLRRGVRVVGVVINRLIRQSARDIRVVGCMGIKRRVVNGLVWLPWGRGVHSPVVDQLAAQLVA